MGAALEREAESAAPPTHPPTAYYRQIAGYPGPGVCTSTLHIVWARKFYPPGECSIAQHLFHSLCTSCACAAPLSPAALSVTTGGSVPAPLQHTVGLLCLMLAHDEAKLQTAKRPTLRHATNLLPPRAALTASKLDHDARRTAALSRPPAVHGGSRIICHHRRGGHSLREGGGASALTQRGSGVLFHCRVQKVFPTRISPE